MFRAFRVLSGISGITHCSLSVVATAWPAGTSDSGDWAERGEARAAGRTIPARAGRSLRRRGACASAPPLPRGGRRDPKALIISTSNQRERGPAGRSPAGLAFSVLLVAAPA